MSLLELVMIAIAASFVLAFAVRFIIGTTKIIYNLAPIVIQSVVVAVLMVQMYGGVEAFKKELGVQDANYTESVEDKSERSRRSEQRNSIQVLPSASSRSQGFKN